MPTYTITSPNKDFSGRVGNVKFKNGKGVTDNEDVIPWFKRREGYKVTKGGDIEQMPHSSVEPQTFGKAPASRDAAVLGADAAGPVSDAYLAPVGAGLGKDPHGPDVVAPGIHGVVPPGIVTGPVVDPAVQESKELEQAAEQLQEPAAVIESPPVEELTPNPPETAGGAADAADPSTKPETSTPAPAKKAPAKKAATNKKAK